MKRNLPAGLILPQASGIRLLMGSQPSAQWWINIVLRIGSESYSYVIEPTYPSRSIIEHVIPFEQFTTGGKHLTSAQEVLVDSLGLDTSVPDATLYLDRITTFRQERYASWLGFTSAQPHHNLFEPGERVWVKLAPGGTPPAGAKALRYEVQDFDEQVVSRGTARLDGSPAYSLDLTLKTHGYYELRAYWVDEGSKDLEGRSCILAEGSLPAGVATFSVLHEPSRRTSRDLSA